VAPAAHYLIGGVKTGLWAETNIKGLFACGEVACTGVHGANRLASNSLLECIVFARRAVDLARESDKWTDKSENLVKDLSFILNPDSQKDSFIKLKSIISQIMSEHVGIVRSAYGLKRALEVFEKVASSGDELVGYYKLKLQNILDVCSLVARSALLRTESRGAHIREDFPNEDPSWKAHIVLKRDSEPLVVRGN